MSSVPDTRTTLCFGTVINVFNEGMDAVDGIAEVLRDPENKPLEDQRIRQITVERSVWNRTRRRRFNKNCCICFRKGGKINFIRKNPS